MDAINKVRLDRVAELTATFFGLGHYSKMPGTLGSAAACAIGVVTGVHWAMIAAVVLIGTWAADRYSRNKGVTDPPEVIIDEVAGMWISMYMLPVSYGFPAFIIFRFVDILKPFPINALEKLPGGIGIMADDMAGGVAVNVILILIRIYFL